MSAAVSRTIAELRSQGGGTRMIDDVVVKVATAEHLAAERGRLDWLHGRFGCPEVLELTGDGAEAVLITRRLDALSAGSFEHVTAGRTTVDALGQALAALHAVPVGDCPFQLDSADLTRLARSALVCEEGRRRLPRALRQIAVERLDSLLFAALPAAPAQKVVVHGRLDLDHLLFDADAAYVCGVRLLGIGDAQFDVARLAMAVAERFGGEAVADFAASYVAAGAAIEPRRLDAYGPIAALIP